ncbi:hypothetical protein K402DRAFT_351545 [Aulographum hederae CBS 113979]|uniref:CENP-V/GFA domain-containing protein n=1 Tax=Aulographum hederae CBS 113979 TaxID=1176131 RepID=A0A6G1H601_9PEZI|nr:hypothetical protein K402DRAFT_351545 [Aulographum hederae CBS 113979]
MASGAGKLLRGSCACGRNEYHIHLPEPFSQHATVFFDNSRSSRRTLSAPLSAWLRVPLTTFTSTTTPYFPDETHQSIRRIFAQPNDDTNERRQFCGYCGTQLTRWDERDREMSEMISVTVGSLDVEDAAALLGNEEDAEEYTEGETQPRSSGVTDPVGSDPNPHEAAPPATSVFQARNIEQSLHLGAPWFESMVQDTPIGRVKRQKGGHTSRDGTVRVEWEVVEVGGDDDDDEIAVVDRSAGEKRKRETA